MRDTIDLWHKVWPDPGAFVRASAQDLERFEALIRADEREQSQKWFDAVTAQHKQLILAEREACAKVCYELPWKDMGHIPSNLAFAAAIRNRGNT
jgi:hypothetical protein